jgi:hypothetical protein
MLRGYSKSIAAYIPCHLIYTSYNVFFEKEAQEFVNVAGGG